MNDPRSDVDGRAAAVLAALPTIGGDASNGRWFRARQAVSALREAGLLVSPSSDMGRILWNTRDDDIDEVVLRDVAVVHVEQMHDRCWWIGITLANGGYWSGNFHADSRGHMTFTQQDCDDIEWSDDGSHDDSRG